MSNLSAPQVDANLILSKTDRKNAGIGSGYVDAYNELQMAKYNNEYNYQLWLQQQDYNSPAKQVERLKEAGLNPNYNSIEGAGNSTSIPSSQGKVTPSIGNNLQREASTIINGFNALLGGISEGVNSVSKLTNTPYNIKGYKELLMQSLGADLRRKDLSNVGDALNVLQKLHDDFNYNIDGYDVSFLGQISPPIDSQTESLGLFQGLDRSVSKNYEKLQEQINSMRTLNGVRRSDKSLKEYDLKYLRPAQIEEIKSRVDKIANEVQLSQQEIDAYQILAANKVLGPVFNTVLNKILSR